MGIPIHKPPRKSMIMISQSHKLIVAAALLAMGRVAVATDVAGTAFLAEKSAEGGVETLPSGLSYRVLEKGSGQFHPTSDSPCLCHYAGTLVDGTGFDSSYDRGAPTTFRPDQVING